MMMEELSLVLLVAFVFDISASASDIGTPPKHFISQPQAGTPEVLGNTKVLVCGADGIPEPSYRWKRDGRFLSTPRSASDAALKIRNIGRTDAGRYQCVATNPHGALLSNSAFVHVAYMRPFANHGNSEQYVSLGQAVVIGLPPIDCYPAPSIQWLEGSAVQISREQFFYHVTLKNQLVILEARQNLDRKVFKAKATNIYTQQTSDSQLFVIRIQNVGNAVGDLNPQVIISPSDTTAIAGSDESAQLECVINARPLSLVTIRWLRLNASTGIMDAINADGVKYLKSTFERVLTILNPSPSDAGTYRCEGSLRRQGTTVGHPVTADAILTVYVEPFFLSSADSEVTAEVEANLTLPCEVSGSPHPTVKWYHNAEPINPLTNRYISVADNGSLVITNAMGDNSGVYQCFATSEAGEINSVTVVNVKSSAPLILTVPYNRTVISGDTVTLSCSSSGAPRPTVNWSRVAAAVATREPVGVSALSQNNLTFANVAVTDAGIYTCTATNSRGSVKMDVQLNVAIRTRISTPPQEFTIHRGLEVMLPCEVISDSRFPVQWHWSFNGVTLDMTDIRHRQRMPDGSLHIRSSDRSDIGIYVCRVVSVGGNDSVTARLNVVEFSHPPTITSLTLSSTSETSADLRWNPPTFNGNSEIRRFIVYFRILNREDGHYRPLQGVTDDEQWQVIGQAEGKSTAYTLHQLQPAQSYQFCISAVNEVGEGRRSAPSSVLTVPQQAPSAPPRGVFGASRSDSSILVQWQSPEKSRWNGPLLGYQISYKLAGYPDSTLRYENVTSASENVVEIDELEPFQEYDIAVAAYNLKGIGVFSDFTRVRTLEGRPVAPPVDVDAQPINSTALSISWTPPHQRHINGINLGYRVVAVPDDSDLDATEVATVASLNMSNLVGRQTWVLASLNKYTKYFITVSCFTSKGDGPKSRPVVAQTLEDVPDRIESLTFGNKIDSRLEIFWTAPRKPNGIITGYLVKCREMNHSTWFLEVELPPRSSNFTLMGLNAYTSYYVDVAAKTRIGIGSSYVTIIESGVAPEKPETPRDVVVKLIEATSVELQMKSNAAQSPATQVRWIVEGECRDPLSPCHWTPYPVNASSTDSFLTVNGLQSDTQYRFRVSAENSAGRSNASMPTEWFYTAASVPSSPPERLIAQVLNATAVMLMWMPLHQLLWNGRGRYYVVRYWTCSNSNPDPEKQTLETDGEESVSIVVSSLEEWTSYCVQVAACNELGCSEFSERESVRTMESVPSVGPKNVTAETINSTAIRVVWSSVPEIHQNGRILGYKVKYRSTLDSSDSVLSVWGEADRYAILFGLQKFTWYQITVTAFTRVGDGATSFPVATTQTLEDVPGTPCGVYFPMTNDSAVRVAWLPPLQPNGIITGYRIEYRMKKLNSSNPEVSVINESLGRDRNEYAATGLQSGAFYTFTVSARTRLGWGEAAEVDVFTGENRRVPVRPNRPTIGPSQIGDRWIMMTSLLEVNGHSPIRNLTIQTKVNDGRFMTHEELVPLDANEFNISGLMPGTRYQIRLAASNDVGLSEFSEESDVIQTHFAIPDQPPTDVSLTQQSSASVLVRWKPPNSEAAWNGNKIGYRIWYRQLSAYDDGIRTGRKNIDDDENAYQTVDTIYPTTNVLLNGLVPKALFEVRVALVNSVGHGPMSSPADIMLKEAVPSVIPENLSAFSLSSTSIRVTWKRILDADDEFDKCLGYKIFYWVAGSKSSTSRVKHASLSESQTVVKDLKMFTMYGFIVAAFGAGGNGQNSSTPVEARTDDGLPGPPERLMAFVTSQTSVNLTWEQPKEPNGLIEGYELTYFQEKLVDGESRSVRVVLSGEKTSYHARDLVLEAHYTFRISAKTRHGFGSEASRSVSIGSQTGVPEAPDELECLESNEGIVLTWNSPNPGLSPLISYIVEYRQNDFDLDSNEWIAVRSDLSDSLALKSEITIGSHYLVPGASYEFRVFAVNSQGISAPSSTVEFIFEREMTHAQSVTAPRFYQRWWFLLAMAFAGFVVVVAVVAALCISGRKRAKSASKDKSWKKRSVELKPLPPQIDDETGFATIERRHPQLWSNQKYPKATTLPLYTRAPPRPSPGSILYDTDLISQHEDSGNVSDKASQNGDSDCENEGNHLAAFLSQSSKRPQSLCGATIPDVPAYTISLNGGHSVMPKYHTLRPTKLSSFA